MGNPKRLKIAIFHELVWPYAKGGGEVQRYEVARRLANTFRHDVSLIGYIMPDTEREQMKDGICIKRTGLRYMGVRGANDNWRRLPCLLGMIWRNIFEDCDVVMANPFLPLPFNVIISKLRRKPVIVTWDDIFGFKTFIEHKGLFMGVVGGLIERAALFFTKFADRVMCVSQSTKDKLVDYGIDEDNIRIIYSGIDLDNYDNNTGSDIKDQICFIGRHVFYKNVDDLLRAFAIVNNKYPNISLRIMGQGPLTDQYKQKAQSLQLDGSIEFDGFVSHKKKLKIISESICTVLPSSFEGFGLTNIETNICGRPYVTYDIPATREVTDITKGGILVEHRNIDALADNIMYLIEHKEISGLMGQRGKGNVKRNFTWARVADIVNEEVMDLVYEQ